MYVVGIDLGTTNTSVCYAKDQGFQQYFIHQLVSEGLVDARSVLPSVVYLPAATEFTKQETALPWGDSDDVIVGEMAKRQSVRAGYRSISSAKSWLCHTGTDRQAAILPWNADIEGKLSAFDVTVKLLSHVKDSWNYDVKQGLLAGLLEEQKIIISVPASFDPAARELTTMAAQKVGLTNLRLIEEPQAALYAWLEEQGDDWREKLALGRKIFVCDVGGGTTDFSLIETDENEGQLSLRRIAVGNHILLGGDNMDLSLAQLLKKRLTEDGATIDERQWHNLVSQVRDAKELLLSDRQEKVEIVLTGSGSGLFRSAVKTALTKSDVETTIVAGFFADCSLQDRPKQVMGAGLREIGLNYAREVAILKHVSAFLSGQEGGFVPPDYVLFNGSMFVSHVLRDRIISNINSWSTTGNSLTMAGNSAAGNSAAGNSAAGNGAIDVSVSNAVNSSTDSSVQALVCHDFSLAVSRGACYYGLVAEGKGIRIKASLPFSYYIGIEKSCLAVPGLDPGLSLLCIAEHGMEEGSVRNITDKSFYLVFGETVQFRLFRSPFRKDQVGFEIDDHADNFEEVSTLEKTLEPAEANACLDNHIQHLAVNLETNATEVGTIDVFCIAQNQSEQRWKLEFDLRKA